jgi:Mitochondrial mRNA-processing protein COX24, C-terminal
MLTRGDSRMGSVVKKRRKRMAKKKHRKLLRKTRVQRRRLGK